MSTSGWAGGQMPRKMPEIRVATDGTRVAVVSEKDFNQAVKNYARKYGWPTSKSTVIVPDTMIFTNVPSPSREIKDYITGDLQEYEEIQKHCILVQCGGFLPPFSTEAWPVEEQKKVFKPVSLGRAYELLFNGQLLPPRIAKPVAP